MQICEQKPNFKPSAEMGGNRFGRNGASRMTAENSWLERLLCCCSQEGNMMDQSQHGTTRGGGRNAAAAGDNNDDMV